MSSLFRRLYERTLRMIGGCMANGRVSCEVSPCTISCWRDETESHKALALLLKPLPKAHASQRAKPHITPESMVIEILLMLPLPRNPQWTHQLKAQPTRWDFCILLFAICWNKVVQNKICCHLGFTPIIHNEKMCSFKLLRQYILGTLFSTHHNSFIIIPKSYLSELRFKY